MSTNTYIKPESTQYTYCKCEAMYLVWVSFCIDKNLVRFGVLSVRWGRRHGAFVFITKFILRFFNGSGNFKVFLFMGTFLFKWFLQEFNGFYDSLWIFLLFLFPEENDVFSNSIEFKWSLCSILVFCFHFVYIHYKM